MERRYVGIKDLSEYLNVSEHTVKSWVYSDRIPFKRIGRLIRFDLKKIDRILEQSSPDKRYFR